MSDYLMLAKSFTDELSWNVQRMLVKSYFKLREVQALAARDAEKEQLKDELLAMQGSIRHSLNIRRLSVRLSRKRSESVYMIWLLKDMGLARSQGK